MSRQGRFIPWQVGSGIQHMATDLWLLNLLESSQPGPILRFYSWSRPTLSLGFHQDPTLLSTRPSLQAIPWVRRPTGGRAVLHQANSLHSDLTYALVVKDLEGSRAQVYERLCQFLQQGLSRWGLDLTLAGQRGYRDQFSCFATATQADLVWQGKKVIGSAQLWRKGVVLQHGTILLAPHRPTWEAIWPGSSRNIQGVYDILNTEIPTEQLILAWQEAAAECLDCSWHPDPLSPAELDEIRLMAPQFEIDSKGSSLSDPLQGLSS